MDDDEKDDSASPGNSGEDGDDTGSDDGADGADGGDDSGDGATGSDDGNGSVDGGDGDGEETIESLTAKNAKLYARAKKAEGFKLVDGAWVKDPDHPRNKKPPKKADQPQLSTADVLALTKASIDEEDLDEVTGYAAYRKISVADALKDKTLQTILSERKEERTTAAATSTRRQSSGGKDNKTGPKLLQDAKAGTLPSSDEGIEALVGARFAAKGSE